MKKHELKYLKDVSEAVTGAVEVIDTNKTLEELETVLALAIRKLRLQISANPEFTRGETSNIEKISAAYLKLTEDKRKQEEHASKNEGAMSEEEMIRVLTESLKALPEDKKRLVIEGGSDGTK
jgi:hypothetical protein